MISMYIQLPILCKNNVRQVGWPGTSELEIYYNDENTQKP